MSTEEKAAKYTPGPWYVEGADAAVPVCAEIDGRTVAFVDYTTVRTDPAEYGANALLIAAAPELFEALEMISQHKKQIVAWLLANGCTQSGLSNMSVGWLRVLVARAAIAKARGV